VPNLIWVAIIFVSLAVLTPAVLTLDAGKWLLGIPH
jgi:hypothetical protein